METQPETAETATETGTRGRERDREPNGLLAQDFR